MRKKLSRGFAFMITLILCFSCFTAAVYAEDKSSFTDSSGTVFESSEDNGVLSSARINTDKDYYWAGEDLQAGAVRIGYDLIAAGRKIAVSSGKVDGAVRIAGQYINLNNLKIGHNTTLAAMDISLNNTDFDSGVFAAKDVSIVGGKANAVNAFAQKIFINSRIDGDLNVECESLELGPGAVVTGTIKGEVGKEPILSSSAKIGKVDVEITPQTSKTDDYEYDFSFFDIIRSLAGLAFIWLILRLLGDGLLDTASGMLTARKGHVFALGAAVFFGAPFAMIVLMITVVGIPVSLIMMMLYAIAIIIAVPYAGSALGRAVALAKRPGTSPWVSTAVGAIVLWVLCRIPFIGWLIKIIAIMFTAGSITDMLREKHRASKANRSVTVDAQPAQAQTQAQPAAVPAEPVVQPEVQPEVQTQPTVQVQAEAEAEAADQEADQTK